MNSIRLAWRRLRTKPLLPLAAILAIALAVATTTTLFGVANAVLLRPLPVNQPDSLFSIDSRSPSTIQDLWTVSYSDYEAIAQRLDRSLVQGLAAYEPLVSFVSAEGYGRGVIGEIVSPNYFEVLGLRATTGRLAADADSGDGVVPGAVISHRLWRAAFGADWGVTGRAMTINGNAFRVLGVVPRDFHGLFSPSVFPTEVWLTPAAGALLVQQPRAQLTVHMKGRASKGATIEAVNAMIQSASREILDSGRYSRRTRIVAVPAGTARTNPVLDHLMSVAGVAATLGGLCLLAVACTNVGLAFMALMHERRFDSAVRVALGATRRRLLLEGLIEPVILAAVGGAAGVCLAGLALNAASRVQSQVLPGVTTTIDPSVDWRVSAFGLAVTLLAATLVSIVALRFMTGVRFGSVLSPAALISQRRPKWLGDVLTAVHVAATVVLLSAAFHLDRALIAELSRDVGFDPDDLVFARLQLADGRTERTLDIEPVLLRLRELPGVAFCTVANQMPFGSDGGPACSVVEVPGGSGFSGCQAEVGPYYFQSLGITVVRGNGRFAPGDIEAAVVSATAARRWWPNADAIGQVFTYGGLRRLRVVGVAADVDHGAGGRERPYFYVPLRDPRRSAQLYILVRQQSPGGDITASINRVLRERLPTGATLTQVSSYRAFMREGPQFIVRVSATLSTSVAVVALLISVLGLYGLVARLTALRKAELAVRAALGANPARLLLLSMGRALAVALVGVVGGTAMSYGAFALLRRIVPLPLAWSLPTSVAVAAVAVAVTGLACYVGSAEARRLELVSILREL